MDVSDRFKRETAREYALRILKQNIVSLLLVPGSLVSENELAYELGISRTPVREALIELSKWKLVEIVPQKGSMISLIDFDMVEEAVFLRKVLESAVVELACDMANEEDILKMQENVKLQEFYLANPSPEKMIELDNKFHRTLFSLCKKQRTYTLMDGMIMHFDRIRTLSLATVKDTKIVSDHKNILEAIMKRDKVLAKELIQKHLSRYKLDQENMMLEYARYFVTR